MREDRFKVIGDSVVDERREPVDGSQPRLDASKAKGPATQGVRPRPEGVREGDSTAGTSACLIPAMPAAKGAQSWVSRSFMTVISCCWLVTMASASLVASGFSPSEISV